MKFISLDIETTSIDPNRGQIVEFAAIIEDTKNKLSFEDIPKFTKIIKADSYKCDIFPIQMHARIWEKLNKVNNLTKEKQREENVLEINELAESFSFFLYDNNFDPNNTSAHVKFTVAGKNVAGFDMPWIKHHVPNWGTFFQVRQRVLDPAILFWDPLLDEELPNLEKCKERAGLANIAVSHDALEDAWDIIQVLRTKY